MATTESQSSRKTQEIQRMPKYANTVEEITSSRGKNIRRMERLTESAERVITLQESVSSVDKGKNVSTQSRFLPVILVNHSLQFS